MANFQKDYYDLEDRTARFAEEIIEFVRILRIDTVNKRIIEQLIGSAGSVGANYCEATVHHHARAPVSAGLPLASDFNLEPESVG